jgi:hypothetical protein
MAQRAVAILDQELRSKEASLKDHGKKRARKTWTGKYKRHGDVQDPGDAP